MTEQLSDPWGIQEALAWFAFVVLVAALFGLSRLWARRHKTPSTPGAEPSPFLGYWECWVYRCDRAATDWVFSPNSGDLFVCRKCAREGTAHGWWAPSETTDAP